MGWRIRAFLINAAGHVERFPYARFERLWERDPDEVLPEHRDAHACFAIAYIETLDNQPLEVKHVDYLRIRIAADGRVDEDEFRRGLLLAARSVKVAQETQEAGNVIDAAHEFHRRRYQHSFSWKPTPDQQHQVLQLAMT